MKRIFVSTILLIILGSLLLSACAPSVISGSGNIVSETRAVAQFNAIDMAEAGDVIVTQGEPQSVRVETDDNLIQYVRTEVRDHTLHIYKEPLDLVTIHTAHPMRVYITVKDISSLNLSGSGSILSDSIKSTDLKLDLSGSGKIVIKEIKAVSLSTYLSGSGLCEIAGEAQQQHINLSGSGSYRASQVNSQKTQIDLSGSGKVNAQAFENLDINLSGSGDVFYSGPAKLSQNISGSGKVAAE